MKRVYILGAGRMQLPAIDIAHAFGWEVVCADGNPEALGRDRADYFESIDLKDTEALAGSVVRWKERRGLDGVFTAGTDFSIAVAYAAEKAGLPGIPVDCARRATDKFLMRETLAQAGLAVPRYCGVAGVGQAQAALEQVGLPAVVKPVDNMGARGIRRVDTWSELVAGIEAALTLSRSGRAIVEEYLEGPEFSLDAIIWRNQFTLCGIADRHICFEPFFIEIGHTMPSAFPVNEQQEVVDIFRRGVEALGLQEGAAKGDIKLTPRGAVIGEIAARLSGGYMSGWTYPLASGVEPTAGALRIAVGLPPGDLSPRFAHFCAERAFFSIPGCLASVEGFAPEAAEAAFLLSREGDELEFPRNNVEKCGNFICRDPKREAAIHRTEEAARRVLLRLEAGNPRTLSFLRGSTDPLVPDAFVLEGVGNQSGLAALPPAATLYSVKRDGFLIPRLPDLEGEAATDWLGRSLPEALTMVMDAVDQSVPVRLSDDAGNVGRGFWRALLRGSVQGGLWYLDSLIGEARIGETAGVGGPW